MDKVKSNYDKTHDISDVKSLPQTTHYAVLVNEQQHVHDYYSKEGGSYPVPFIQYIVFDDVDALNAWVLNKLNVNKVYKVVSVNPVEVKIHTTVTIKE